MGVTTAASGLVFLLLTVPVIHGQNDHSVRCSATELCALRGSTVDISCTVTDKPTAMIQESIWFIEDSNGAHVDLKSKQEYSDRVLYGCYNNRCTLRITDLRESDSAEYKFSFKRSQDGEGSRVGPGVTLSVTDLQVQVNRTVVFDYNSFADLTCQSSCRLPDHPFYIWYQNHQELPEKELHSVYFSSSVSISCAVQRHKNLPSPTVWLHNNRGYTVSYTSTEICALRGSTVDITCTYSYPLKVYENNILLNNSQTTVQTSFWFVKSSNRIHADLRSDQDYSGRVEYLCGNNKCTLRIKDLRDSDSAEYKFWFITNQERGTFSGSPGVKVTVTDLQVQVERITVYDSYSSAELRCRSSCRLPDHPSYIWYKNQHEAKEVQSYSEHFSSSDSVYCAVRGYENVPSPAVSIHRTKGYSVSYPSTEICAVTGSTMNITCTYSYPLQVYDHTQYRVTTVQESFWFVKDSKDLRSERDYSGRVDYLCENNKCTLRIKDVRESDSARYKFRFKTNQDGGAFTGQSKVFLRIGDPQLHVSVRRSVGQFSAWTELTCQSSCQLPEHQSYVWYKNWQEVGGNKYVFIKDLNPSDRYLCAIRGRWDLRSPSVYVPKPPSVSVTPSGEIVEGSSVTLTCRSNANPAASYTWYKETGNTFQPLGAAGTRFFFDSISSSDSGQYQCRAQNELGRVSANSVIDVKYAPKPPSVSASPSADIVEGSSVSLTCSTDANPPATYTWYKENGTSVKLTGQSFTITDVGPEHGGHYYCEVQNERGRGNASLHLSVRGAHPTWKTAVIGTTIAIMFAIMLVFVILLIRKMKTSEPGERSDNREQEEQNEPHYASVQFLKDQTSYLHQTQEEIEGMRSGQR